jgi:tetratricopeptide (TPR) repeat protein/transcriptional regulator with XRE-family HTH domain
MWAWNGWSLGIQGGESIVERVNSGGFQQKGLGEVLRQARRMAGLTQEQLAEQSGLSVRAVGDLERGRTGRPHWRSVELLAVALGLPESAYVHFLGGPQVPADPSALPRSGWAAGAAATRAAFGDGRPGPLTPDSAGPLSLAWAGRGPGLPAQDQNGATLMAGMVEVSHTPAQLPADIADFTGRGEQVTRLRRMLAGQARGEGSGAVTIALLAGAGGLGKTTLAMHVAHSLLAEFPDGQLYAHLLGTSQRPAEPAEVLARFLRELGMNSARIPAGEDERAAQYRSRLAGRRMLIVLDDARDAAQVRSLVPGFASSAVLVTSRNRMPDLAGRRLIDLDVLEQDEARALFAAVVGQGRAEAEPEAAGEVLAACAGLPLAIRIAGARLAARSGWTVRTMAGRLSDERRRLDELKTGDLAVRTCFEMSFSSLPGRNQPDGIDPAHAFRLLGVWAGPSIGLPAAVALLGQPEEAVADALEVLVDAQLLQSPAPDRYQFHDLLRAYAADRVLVDESFEVRDQAVRRILTWYLHTVDAIAQLIAPHRYRTPLVAPGPVCPPLAFQAPEQALDWCETERANLLAATRQAAASGLHGLAWQLPIAAMNFYNRRTHVGDWVATHHVALASVRLLGDRLGEAAVLNSLGMALRHQGQDEGVALLERALAIRREIGDLPGEAQIACNMAEYFVRMKRIDEALDLLKQALEIHRLMGHQYGEGVALNNFGEAYLALGRVDEAIDRLKRAREIFAEIGDLRGEGYALNNLGEAYLASGLVSQAGGCLRRALELRQGLGDRFQEAQTLRVLGQAALAGGEPDEASRLLTRSQTIFEEFSDDAQVAAIRAQLAALSRGSGRATGMSGQSPGA